MKLLRSFLILVLVALVSSPSLAPADTDDSVRLLVFKSNDETAKIEIGSRDYLVPISFEGGFTWNDVKDAYHIPPAYAALLKEGRISIYIGCSGAAFRVTKRASSK